MRSTVSANASSGSERYAGSNEAWSQRSQNAAQESKNGDVREQPVIRRRSVLHLRETDRSHARSPRAAPER